MKKKIIKFLIIGLSIALILNIGMYGYVYWLKRNVKKLYNETKYNEKVYVYETFFNAANNALYVDDLKDSNALIRYYDYQAQHIDSPAYLPRLALFPIKTKPVYVLNDLGSSSKMMQIIDFDTTCWGYIKGYVYKNTVHLNPPADSFLKKEQESIKNNRPINVVHKIPNPYGWYCKSWEE